MFKRWLLAFFVICLLAVPVSANLWSLLSPTSFTFIPFDVNGEDINVNHLWANDANIGVLGVDTLFVTNTYSIDVNVIDLNVITSLVVEGDANFVNIGVSEGIYANRYFGTGDWNIYNGTNYCYYDVSDGDFACGGVLTSAIGGKSVAFGQWNSASGTYSGALYGFGSKASAGYSLAGGNYSEASDNYAIALGSYAEAGGISSVAIGTSVKALQLYSVAIGNNVINSDVGWVALATDVNVQRHLKVGEDLNVEGDVNILGETVFGGNLTLNDNNIRFGTPGVAAGNNEISGLPICFATTPGGSNRLCIGLGGDISMAGTFTNDGTFINTGDGYFGNGNDYFEIDGDLNVTGDVNFGGDFAVEGITFNNGGMVVTGDSNFTNIAVSENAFIKDILAETIALGGALEAGSALTSRGGGANVAGYFEGQVPQLVVGYDLANAITFYVLADGELELDVVGTDPDLDISTDNFEHCIFVDDSVGRIGFGTSTPSVFADFKGDVKINSGFGLNNYLILEGWGGGLGTRGGHIEWNSGGISSLMGYTYTNLGNQFVWDSSPQAGGLYAGNAWVRFTNGAASFAGGSFTINSTGNTVLNDLDVKGNLDVDGNYGAYGEYWASYHTHEITMPTAGVYHFIGGDWNTGDFYNVDMASDINAMTIEQNGMYLVNVSLSFTGDQSVEYDFAIFVNGVMGGAVTDRDMHIVRTTATNAEGAVSISGTKRLTTGDTIDLRVEQVSAPNKKIIISNVNFAITRIG